jgi:hypothetical protein
LREARQVSKSMASSNAPPYKATGLQDKITHPSTDQSAEITVPPAPPIANEDDHDSVRFWKKSEWRNFEESERKRNRNTVKFSFICDEFGESVASSRIDEIGDAAKLAWNELHHFRLAPTTWAKKIDRADRTEICIGTDIAILAFSSGILKNYAPFFLNLQPIFTKIGAVTDPYSCRLNRTK